MLHGTEMKGGRLHTRGVMRLGISAISTLAMVTVQTLAHAQSGPTPGQHRQAIADEAAAFARGIRNTVPPATIVDGNIVFGLEGRVADVPLSSFFTDADNTGADAGVAHFGSDTSVLEAAGARIDALEQGTGPESRAWETWRATAVRTPPALTYSEIFSVSENVLDTLETYGQCTVEDTFEPFPRSVTTYEERTCNRRSSEFEACTVHHDLEIGLDTVSMHLDAVPGRAVEIDLDDGILRTQHTVYRVENSQCNYERDSDVVIACWNDYVRDYTWVEEQIPPLYRGACRAGALTNASATLTQSPNCGNGMVARFEEPDWRTTVTRSGVRIEPLRTTSFLVDPVITHAPPRDITFDLELPVVTRDVWGPADCVEAINAHKASACGAMLAVSPGSASPGCIDTGIGTICPHSPLWDDIAPPPFDLAEEEVPRSARQVRLSAPQCEIETAESCWIDVNGQSQCAILSSGDPLGNACAPLLEDPACTYADTALLFDTDQPGHFDLYEDRFLCAAVHNVVDQRLVRQAVCSGGLPGMGGLVSEPREVSGSFGKASAYLSAARMIAMDTGCEDQADPATCEIFKGTPASCKVAVFGYQNCCESPGGIGLGDYLALILAVGEVDSAVRGLDAGNTLRASYEALVDPVTLPFEEAWSAVSETFANNVNSIFGTTVIDTAEAASSGLITSVQQSLMKQAAEWTAEIFGDAAANALFEVTQTGASEATAAVVDGLVQEGLIQLTQTLASVLSIVSIAYTIYSVAKLLIQIIWACEEEELALAVQRDLKSAHYVGPYCSQKALFACLEKRKAYCTFSSPLSRIVQQQARPQLGLDWGSPQAPQCTGLTLEEFARIDWEEVDLSEWEAIILTEGVIPDPSEFSVETLTGQGHTLADPVQTATGAARQDVVERMFERTQNLDFEAARKRAGDSLRSGGLP